MYDMAPLALLDRVCRSLGAVITAIRDEFVVRTSSRAGSGPCTATGNLKITGRRYGEECRSNGAAGFLITSKEYLWHLRKMQTILSVKWVKLFDCFSGLCVADRSTTVGAESLSWFDPVLQSWPNWRPLWGISLLSLGCWLLVLRSICKKQIAAQQHVAMIVLYSLDELVGWPFYTSVFPGRAALHAIWAFHRTIHVGKRVFFNHHANSGCGGRLKRGGCRCEIQQIAQNKARINTLTLPLIFLMLSNHLPDWHLRRKLNLADRWRGKFLMGVTNPPLL